MARKTKNNTTLLARNICAWRTYFGETQTQLAKIVSCTQHAISQYENDSEDLPKEKRHIPTADTLKALAQHFDITVYQLEKFDYEYLSNPEKDAISFYQNIDIVYPIVCTDRALKNKSFNAAYQSHLALYNRLKASKTLDSITANFEEIAEEFDEIESNYQEALKYNTINPETSVNILACCSFELGLLSSSQILLNEANHNNAFIAFMEKRYPEIEHYIKSLSKEERQEYLLSVNEDIKELKNKINKLRTASKAKYPDLIYYHLALQYLLGFADSDMELAYTQHIGQQMMDAFKEVGNKYAINFLDSF